MTTGKETIMRSLTSVRDAEGPPHATQWLDNQFPTLYMSAGKHHPFLDMSWDGVWDSPFSAWYCTESVDGRGKRILAEVESPGAPHGRHNAGEPGEHPAEHFVNDLAPFGFPGEDAWRIDPFCGGFDRPRSRECTHSPESSVAALLDN